MKALLIVDVQNDFLPGGALAAKQGDTIIDPINTLMSKPFDLIVASKDWHPKDHGSFASRHGKKPGEHVMLGSLDQVLWPGHCVQNTKGAEFPAELDTTPIEKVFLKGTNKTIDSYSAFFDNGHLKSTGLADFLKKRKIEDLYLVGLTTDYCVKFTALDAIQEGFNTYVIVDACKAVNLQNGDEEQAIQEMQNAGAIITTSEKVF